MRDKKTTILQIKCVGTKSMKILQKSYIKRREAWVKEYRYRKKYTYINIS